MNAHSNTNTNTTNTTNTTTVSGSLAPGIWHAARIIAMTTVIMTKQAAPARSGLARRLVTRVFSRSKKRKAAAAAAAELKATITALDELDAYLDAAVCTAAVTITAERVLLDSFFAPLPHFVGKSKSGTTDPIAATAAAATTIAALDVDSSERALAKAFFQPLPVMKATVVVAKPAAQQSWTSTRVGNRRFTWI